MISLSSDTGFMVKLWGGHANYPQARRAVIDHGTLVLYAGDIGSGELLMAMITPSWNTVTPLPAHSEVEGGG